MKRAVSILLACLLICPCFVACGHEHTWNEGVITTAATCEASGVKTFTCTDCDQTRTEAVAAIGHAWDEGTVTTDATHEADGVKTFTCAHCATTKTEPLKPTTAVTKAQWDAIYVDGNGSLNCESRTQAEDGTTVFMTCNGITHILTYENKVLTSDIYYEGDYCYTVEGETVTKDKRSTLGAIFLPFVSPHLFSFEDFAYDPASKSYKAAKIETEYEQEGTVSNVTYTDVEIRFLNGVLYSESFLMEEVVTIEGEETWRYSSSITSTYGTVSEIVIPTPTIDKTRPTVTADEWLAALNLLCRDYYNHTVTSTQNGETIEYLISKISSSVHVSKQQGDDLIDSRSFTVDENGNYHRFPHIQLPGFENSGNEWVFYFEYHNIFSYRDFTYDEATRSYVAERFVYQSPASDANAEPEEWVFTDLSLQFTGGELTALSYILQIDDGASVTVTETLRYSLLNFSGVTP